MVTDTTRKGINILYMIVLRVNGKDLKQFSNVNVTLGIDTVASTFNFGLFFDGTDPEIREIVKPFSYADCQVWFIDEENNINQRLITGTILNPGLSSQRQPRLTSLSGYSKTGIFQDSNIPTELYPLQFDGIGLGDIAKKICDYFGISLLVFDNAKAAATQVFEKAKAQPSQTIKDFLSQLSRDRNITLSHDNLGRLLLYKIEAKIPAAIKIDENDKKVISISMSPNAQAMHSSITVIRQSSTLDQNEAQTTVTSPFVKGIKRPKVEMLQNGTGIDTEKRAKAIASAEAKNFPITIEIEGWTFENRIVRAGFYIQLTAPSIFLSTTKLILQTVTFKSDPKKGRTLTLIAVLPCVYTGELPSKSPFKKSL